ncbi:MAG TPA: LysM peptidoglycan-binding domain-containing protein [Verrucomicrobiae bacterium]|nr:LysM peptidoglycan-binding domain-containing protein [Verrucomicrobiae bacterium]
MNNSNPFVPQGSLLEQKNKKRARVKVAVFSIFALNILVITPLLIQGCSKKDTDQSGNNQPVDTSAAAATTPDTNQPPALPQVASNAAPDNTTTSNSTTAANPVTPAEPTPAVPPPTPPTPSATEYVITKGDTYYSIAKKYGLKMSDIKAANPSVNPSKLKVGQKIELPSGASAGGTGTMASADSGDVYVVKSGDSLTKIARANGVTVKALKAENNLKTDHIRVGQKLKVPAKAAATPADTTASATPIPQPAPVVPPSTTTASNGTLH